MRHYLLPVWGDSRFVGIARDFGMEWGEWFDVPPYDYPHALISYIHWKKPYQFPESAHIFGDSGGFSLTALNKTIKIDPIDVLRWQEATCTVGCILDLPPGRQVPALRFVETGKRSIRHRLWDDALLMTRRHTERALPIYRRMRARGTRFRWWGVLHGNTSDEVRRYHEAIAAIYPFTDEGEGWAIRPEPLVDIYACARSVRVLSQLGIRRAHFLAATRQKVMTVLVALGSLAGMELVTYDSAYAAKYALNRGLFRANEDGLTFKVLMETGPEHFVRDYVREECTCPICVRMRERSETTLRGREQMARGDYGGWYSSWLLLHNLYAQTQLGLALGAAAIADPDKTLRLMLTPREYSTVMRIYERDGFEPKPAETGNSVSLLDYLG